MKPLYSIILLFLLVAPAKAISQGTTGSMPEDFVTSAKTFVDFLAKSDFGSAVGYFDTTMKTALPEEKLKEAWASVVTRAGAFKRQTGARTEKAGEYEVVFVTCEFEKGSLDVKVVFNQAKRVAGLFFVPAKAAEDHTPPGYATLNAFLEKEVTVGGGEWALPGTLTVPKGPGPYPAVVLVHGSGPNDRDETIGPNKPFRDLAWGLSSRGIIVLRYEKRTRQHASKFGRIPGRFTVKEETVDDALAAVTLLRRTEGVDAGRIFVLGHSLGGMLIPRICERDKGIAGCIVMAGAASPLEDAIIEQMTYIFSLEGTISGENAKLLEETKLSAAKIKALKPSDASSSAYILGAPASYWLDLQGYNPPRAAQKTAQPLLILQGERDYQVTMTDFGKWKTALSSRKDVTFKSYPGLNHLFIEGKGSGKSTPSEYAVPGHIAEQVILDVDSWIKERRK